MLAAGCAYLAFHKDAKIGSLRSKEPGVPISLTGRILLLVPNSCTSTDSTSSQI
jgi:hypothetical protein